MPLIGSLGREPLPLLVKRFGILGGQLKAMGNGVLNRPIGTVAQDPKSIGHSITLASGSAGGRGVMATLQKDHRHRVLGRFQDLHETDHPPCPR